jgi:hypothetical protein
MILVSHEAVGGVGHTPRAKDKMENGVVEPSGDCIGEGGKPGRRLLLGCRSLVAPAI